MLLILEQPQLSIQNLVHRLGACQCNDDITMPPKLWLHLFWKMSYLLAKTAWSGSMTWNKRFTCNLWWPHGHWEGWHMVGPSMVHYQVVRSPSKTRMKVYPSMTRCIDMCKWQWCSNHQISGFSAPIIFPQCDRKICFGWLELHTVWGETSVLLEFPLELL